MWAKPLSPRFSSHQPTPAHPLGCVDFLPYKCAVCTRWHCGAHRRPETHACAAGAGAATFERTPDDAAAGGLSALAPKPRAKAGKCRAKGCKTALTVANTTACSRCGGRTCLRHRHPDDHACAGSVAPVLPSLHLVVVCAAVFAVLVYLFRIVRAAVFDVLFRIVRAAVFHGLALGGSCHNVITR